MKVLLLITKSNWGGAQRYVYDLATNLPKDIYDVEVMTGGTGELIDRLLKSGIKASGNLPVGRDINLLEDIRAFFKLLSIIKEKRPDILHVNSSKIGGLGALAGRIMRVPKIIFTAHGWAFNENRTLISKIFIRLSYWFTILLSHRTITVSEATKYQTRNWPIVFDKMTVIHNGIKTEAGFSKLHARTELEKINSKFSEIIKTKTTKDTIFIVSIGELHHIKGYKYSIEAISELSKNPYNKKVIYLIIGEGEDRLNIEKEIKNLGLDNSVFLLGNIPNAYQYIKAFDIFLIPSISEGLPYIALEAGLYSLPTIASAVGGIPEIIDDMKSGVLIQPKKAKEIQYAIEFYLNHKKVQKEHAIAIHKKIIEDFSIEKMISKTVEIYSKDSKVTTISTIPQ